MKLSDLYQRYAAYLVDMVLLVSLTELICHVFGIYPVIYTFVSSYSLEFSVGFHALFDTYSGLMNLLILYVISFGYFFLDSLTGKCVGSLIWSLKLVNVEERPRRLLEKRLVRSAIKAFPISNLIDFLFFFKYPKYLMRLSDSKMGMVRGFASERGTLKPSYSRFILSASIIYYSNFFFVLVTSSIKGPSNSITDSVGYLSATPFLSQNFETFFSQIFSNNFALDLNLMIGGIFLFTSTLIKMISSNLIDAGLTSIFIQQAGLGGFFRTLFPPIRAGDLGVCVWNGCGSADILHLDLIRSGLYERRADEGLQNRHFSSTQDDYTFRSDIRSLVDNRGAC